MADDHVTTITIADLVRDERCQARTWVNSHLVQEYSESMREGATFPPVVVFSDGASLWLADGHLRVAAAHQCGQDTIEAEVRPGGLRDAILHAVQANATHGQRRSGDDKRKAARTLLEDPEWRRWSNAEIARRCRVSHTLVNAVRASLEAASSDQSEHRTYRTRWGGTSTMDTANIGKQPYQIRVRMSHDDEPEVDEPAASGPIADAGPASFATPSRPAPVSIDDVASEIVRRHGAGRARAIAQAVLLLLTAEEVATKAMSHQDDSLGEDV